MRIAIDITPLQTEHKDRGVGEYVYNLLRKLGEQDNQNHYLLFAFDKVPIEAKLDFKNFELIKIELWGRFVPLKRFQFSRLIWYQYLLPRALKKYSVDLFHSPVHSPELTIPLFVSCPMIVTIHDLISGKFLTGRNKAIKSLCLRFFLWFMNLAANRARRIIVDSVSSKSDVIALLGVAPKRIDVINLAKHECYRPIAKEQVTRILHDKYNLKPGYILYVGSASYNKNIERLLTAYKILVENENINNQLVMVGGEFVNIPTAHERIRRFNLDGKIVLIGEITKQNKEDLAVLYNGAEVFVFPSLYEGFGMPPLEAMACGVPVVSSCISSLPEVTGDAAVLVDPYSIDDIVKGILSLLDNIELRQTIIKRGLNRATLFSWDKLARETLMVYQKAIEGVIKGV